MLLVLLASSLMAQGIIESPNHCLKKEANTCKIKTKKNANIKLSSVSLYVDKGSVLEIYKDAITLINGSVIVDGSRHIRTVYGNFKCKDCKLYLADHNEELEVKLLEGKMFYKKFEENKWSEYPKYFKNSISKINPITGKSEESIFRALSLEDYKRAYKNYPSLKEELKEKEEYYTKILRDQRFVNSKIYQSAAHAKLERKKAIEKRKAQKKQEWLREREEMRKLYRKKNYLLE